MTNFEMLKGMTVEKAGRFLCDQHDLCGHCIAQELCSPEHNGYVEWLRQEETYDKD